MEGKASNTVRGKSCIVLEYKSERGRVKCRFDYKTFIVVWACVPEGNGSSQRAVLQLENCICSLIHNSTSFWTWNFDTAAVRSSLSFNFSAWISLSSSIYPRWSRHTRSFSDSPFSLLLVYPTQTNTMRNLFIFSILWFWKLLNYGNLWQYCDVQCEMRGFGGMRKHFDLPSQTLPSLHPLYVQLNLRLGTREEFSPHSQNVSICFKFSSVCETWWEIDATEKSI